MHLGVVSPANYFAPRLMQAFRELYPAVRVKLSIGKRGELWLDCKSTALTS